MPSTSIDDNDIEAFFLELRNTLCSYSVGVCLSVRTKVSYLGLCRRLTCLIESSSTEGICTDDTCLKSSLLIVYS